MSVQARRLADALSRRLEPHAPTATSVSTERIFPIVEGRIGWAPAVDDALAASAVWNVLRQLQDDLSEESAVPWPVWNRGEGGPFYDFEVEIRDEAIHAWFGDRDCPVLALEPITFAELDA